MKKNNFKRFFLKVLIAAVCFLLPTSVFAVQAYKIIDLGTLNGKFSRVSPSALNEKGEVVGTGFWWDTENRLHSEGFIWDNINGMRNIGDFGGNNTNPSDINDSGQVVGYSDYADSRWRHAFLWENGSMTDLGTGWASGINELGTVVGGSNNGAFIWDNTNGRKNPFGEGDIRPSGINDNGKVVGTAINHIGSLQAFIWDEINGLQFLDMPADLQASVGADINNSSKIVGHGDSIYEPHYHHSYVWNNTHVISGLGSLGGNQEWAFGINYEGVIVGNATAPNYMRYGVGFIWDEINAMKNLNDLIIRETDSKLLYISSAIDINDKGQIIAQGIVDEENGIYHAFLLTPVPSTIEVDIDIKPGSDPNSINLKSNGVVPVAILSTIDFKATAVDPGTVLFADASPVKWTMEDVNRDGDLDLLLHFKTQDLNLTQDSAEATLTGKTMDGTPITGTDTVNIVPKKKK